MAPINILFLQFSLFLSAIIATTAIATTATTTKSTGFSFKLIHRDSELSPFRPRNLTNAQLFQRLIHLSNLRVSWLKSSIVRNYSTTTIRPPVIESGSIYLVQVMVGTGQARQVYYMELDTGSSLTWTQCQPCNPCFPQATPIFDPRRSPTYRRIACDDPWCVHPYRCENNECVYRVTYGDGSNVEGILSKETFTFRTSAPNGTFESIGGLVFGCTHRSVIQGERGGMLGMDARRASFAMQLISQTGGRFSYCLIPLHSNSYSFLRFGTDIPMRRPVHRMQIVTQSGFYQLRMNDVTVGDRRLHLPPGIFERSIIDSGTGMTYLITPVYNRVRRAFEDYFSYFNMDEVNGADFGMEGLDLCYVMPSDFEDEFPTMTLHFQGADLHIKWENLFMVERTMQMFCLAMLPEQRVTILGAYQQMNTRFTYDLVDRELYFAPEECHHN